MEEDLVQKPTSQPRISFFVYYLAAMAVIGGFLFGYDTGVVSSAMLYIPDYHRIHPMSTLWKELVVSITTGTAALGALLAGQSTDYFGRKKVIIMSSFIFVVGAALCAGAWEKVSLLCGRILLGIAIGFASMVVPIYIGEASPSSVRGRLVTGFQLAVTFGLLAASLISGAFSYIDPKNVGWRLMLGFAAIPAIIQFIGFFFLPESPRHLYEKGRKDEAKEVLLRIYSGDEEWAEYEMSEIERVCEEERTAKRHVGDSLVIVRMLRTPHVRKALFVGCGIQLFQQFSGVNTIMYYTGTIIKAAGVEDNHETIWVSSAVSAINFVSTFFPIIFVEKLGRRKLFLASMFGVLCALAVMGGAFVLINKDSADTFNEVADYGDPSILNQTVKHFDNCRKKKNCDSCVLDENCGFCHNGTGKTKGYCLPTDSDDDDYATTGFCSHEWKEKLDFEFKPDYCKTKYTPMPIVVMVVYMMLFAVGYAPLPWVMNAEFYPLWARSTGCSLSTFFNWICNLAIALTFLSLSQAVTKYGAFWIYGGVTVIAMVFVYFLVPETKGVPIEETELLFMSKSQRDALRSAKNNGTFAANGEGHKKTSHTALPDKDDWDTGDRF